MAVGLAPSKQDGNETRSIFHNKRESGFDVDSLRGVNTSQATPHLSYLPDKREQWTPPSASEILRYKAKMSIESSNEADGGSRFLQDVQRTCLQATQKYINDFRRNIEQRCLDERNSLHGSTSISTVEDSSEVSLGSVDKLYRESHATASLRTNVSTVCDIIWAESRKTRMLRPGSEASAASDMLSIAQSSDRVLRGFERQENEPIRAMVEVLCAAMRFCGWFGDHDKNAIMVLGNAQLGEGWNKW